MATQSTKFSATSQDFSDFLAQLPKEKWMPFVDLYQWEGSWYLAETLESTLACKSNFEARDDDIILATPPKAGTTWLKALLTAIMLGSCKNGDEEDPLVKENPHTIVKSLEIDLYSTDRNPDLSGIPSPRIFHTHLPYNSLPDSIKNSRCKVVYIARNPKDVFVSFYHYMNQFRTPEAQNRLDHAFDDFCKGIHFFGPYHDHVLGYWNRSLNSAEKFLFIKYEEMKTEPKGCVKKLAEFLGKPFQSEEEIEHVLWRCSIERLKNLEVNVSGTYLTIVKNSSFFRLGVVGDWKNTLTKEMGERLDQVTRYKLQGSGLDL